MKYLRYIFALPISIICTVVFPYLYVLLIDTVIFDNSFAKLFIFDGTPFILQGIIFIIPAYFIIPKFKNQAMIVFLILWYVVVIFGDSYLYNTNSSNVGAWNSFLRLLGATLASLNIFLESRKHQQI
jgi:hypothetical protein